MITGYYYFWSKNSDGTERQEKTYTFFDLISSYIFDHSWDEDRRPTPYLFEALDGEDKVKIIKKWNENDILGIMEPICKKVLPLTAKKEGGKYMDIVLKYLSSPENRTPETLVTLRSLPWETCWKYYFKGRINYHDILQFASPTAILTILSTVVYPVFNSIAKISKDMTFDSMCYLYPYIDSHIIKYFYRYSGDYGDGERIFPHQEDNWSYMALKTFSAFMFTMSNIDVVKEKGGWYGRGRTGVKKRGDYIDAAIWLTDFLASELGVSGKGTYRDEVIKWADWITESRYITVDRIRSRGNPIWPQRGW